MRGGGPRNWAFEAQSVSLHGAFLVLAAIVEDWVIRSSELAV